MKQQVFGISQNAMNYEKLAELEPQAVIITGEGTWRDAQEMLDRFGIKVIVINSYYTDQLLITAADRQNFWQGRTG